jgi:Cof subfamily protein (haloacid dehalogenase superfamily)
MLLDKKLIFFDVDGTLISYKNVTYIPIETIEAINRLKENGHMIAVATGRSYQMAKHILSELKINYAVLENGAHIVTNGESVYEKRISKGISSKICKVLLKTSLCVFAFDVDYVYVNNISEESRNYIETNSGRKDIIKPLADNKNSLFSIHLYGESNEISEYLKSIKSIDFKENQFEITTKGISKSNGIKRLAKLLDISHNNIIAVGDGINDIDMIKAAGIGIAVGNACAQLKAVADIVTEDIENGGILKAFKELKLI